MRLFFVGGGGTNQEKLKQRLIELGTQFYNSPWNLNALYQDVLVCMEQLNWIQFPENSQQIVEHIDLELTQETENAIEELVVNAEDKRQKFGQQIFEQVGYYQKKNYSEIWENEKEREEFIEQARTALAKHLQEAKGAEEEDRKKEWEQRTVVPLSQTPELPRRPMLYFQDQIRSVEALFSSCSSVRHFSPRGGATRT